jgi:carbon-monoxide dehydrogenase large subunit
MPSAFFGAPVRRLEDDRLLRGQAHFVEDLVLPDLVHASFVRSQLAHGCLHQVDLAGARAAEGVMAAFAHADLRPLVAADREPTIPTSVGHPALRPCNQPFLAHERVRYVGEPIAVVVAEGRALANDAAGLVGVDLDHLPVAASAERAVAAGAPLLHPQLGENLAATFEVVVGEPDAVFAHADRVVRGRFYVQRYTGMPMETRGVVAAWDPGLRQLTVWSSTQWPHTLRDALATSLGLAPSAVRVVAPDVGGGFGIKQEVYPEEIVIGALARRLRRPVKWIETRSEHCATAAHAREQWHDVALALSADGTMLGMTADVLSDQGAYTRALGVLCPSLTAAGLPGPYRFHNYRCRVRVALTNKAPAAAYRGAGQPEAVFATERLVDRAAQELGIDPAALRRQNFIRPEDFPWDVGTTSAQVPVIYDSGEYAAGLDRALQLADYRARRAEQAAERARPDGRWLGIGLAAYVMLTGLGPHEGSVLRVDADGKLVLVTGASPHGQGTATALAQIVADELGVRPTDVSVRHGDTDAISYGVGTYASRNAVVAGGAAQAAARRVRDKAMALAARQLETAPEDLELVDGGVQVRGLPSRRRTLGQLAAVAAPGQPIPVGLEPGLESTQYFLAPRATFASGVHLAVIEIDRDSFEVRILDYVVLSDAGPLINPMIVQGQIVGGVAQGLGGALYEELTYDANGQLLASSLLDYCMPTVRQVPDVRVAHLQTRSPLNPLGIKGLGEGGALAPPPAIANAVEDALGHLGVRVDATPLTANRIAALLSGVGFPGSPTIPRT